MPGRLDLPSVEVMGKENAMTIRLVMEGAAKDYAAYLTTIKKWEEHARSVPGTMSSEGFIDPETCRFLWIERYDGPDTLMALIAAEQENGLFEEILSVCEFDNMVSLEPTDDPRVNAMLDQFGAKRLQQFAEVATA